MKLTNLFVAAIATVILASCGGEATTSTEAAADTVAVEAPAVEAPADTTAEAPAADSTAVVAE